MKRGFLKQGKGKGLYGESFSENKPRTQQANQITKKSEDKPTLQVHEGEPDLIARYRPTFDGSTEYVFNEVPPGTRVKDEGEAWYITSLPQSLDPPGGQSVVLMWPGFKELIVSQPGFPKPVPKDPAKPFFEMRDVPGIGKGLFATRDIPSNQLICAERPLLLYRPRVAVRVTPNKPVDQMSTDDWHTLQKPEIERIFGKAVSRMTPENKEIFMSLANIHTDDGSGPCTGIIRTNGMELTDVMRRVFPQVPEEEPPRCFSMVSATLSRINHSCSPNVNTKFYMPSLHLEIRASRDIKAGEQLLLTYSDLLVPQAERQKQLNMWRFTCKCRSCVNAKVSDVKRAKINALKFGDKEMDVLDWVEDPSLSNDYFPKKMLKYVKMCEDEGVQRTHQYGDYMLSLAWAYIALGDIDSAEEWGRKAVKALEAIGEDVVLKHITDPSSATFIGKSNPTWCRKLMLGLSMGAGLKNRTGS